MVGGEGTLTGLDPASRRRVEALLLDRLRALGLRHVTRLTTHTNRTVMLSWRRGTLRLHLGYAVAPDRVLRAIVRFLRPGVPRALRKALEHEFLTFPVHQYAPPRERRTRAERPRPGDLRILHQLSRLHERFNQEHFGGALREVPFRLSSRMRTRLGEISVNPRTGEVIDIGISRSHLRRHGWAEVAHTVLHEMVHQWQVETGQALDHGPGFRRKAREVGIAPRARRGIEAGGSPVLSSRGFLLPG